MSHPVPRRGEKVFSSDGLLIGHVADVTDTCFKVDRPLSEDEWLATDLIAQDDYDITLSVPREALEGGAERIEHSGLHVHRHT